MSHSVLDEFERVFDKPSGMSMSRSGGIITLKYDDFTTHRGESVESHSAEVQIGGYVEDGWELVDVRPLWGEERMAMDDGSAVADYVEEFC